MDGFGNENQRLARVLLTSLYTPGQQVAQRLWNNIRRVSASVINGSLYLVFTFENQWNCSKTIPLSVITVSLVFICLKLEAATKDVALVDSWCVVQ